MTTVLAIPGSLRRASFNRLLLRAASEVAPSDLNVRLFDDLGSIPLFDEDLEQETDGGPGSVRHFRGQVAAADGILIATPEYNWSIPGVLKNAIDWLSRPFPDALLEGKPVAIIGASGGRWGTRLAQAALRQVFASTESLVLPAPALFVSAAADTFDETGRLIDPSIRAELERVLVAFDRWISWARTQALEATHV